MMVLKAYDEFLRGYCSIHGNSRKMAKIDSVMNLLEEDEDWVNFVNYMMGQDLQHLKNNSMENKDH